MKRIRELQGSLLIELLVVCALIALFLPLLVTAFAQMQERHLLAQTHQDQRAIKAAIDAHFQAQWARLRPASCRIDATLLVMIGSGTSAPSRLAARDVDETSDWLMGVDYGLCRGTTTVRENPLDVTLDCHWNAGDNVSFASCESNVKGQVFSTSARKSVIKLENDLVIGQSGIIESEDGFYWYLSEGMQGRKALWRTPDVSGTSLELWNGIERLSFFPLLDNSGNGMVDTLDTQYGAFPVTQLRGLWVEYLYRMDDCKLETSTLIEQEYRSMRGDIWRYSSPCQGVGNHIVVL
ncbi:hypothetical protein MACH16_21190 [Marinomonas pontica]|uniref:Type II secretion system protein n=1 Tax=Marinomonas pontica TaxID=264739 RepID=A0ABM8FE55_9GAMM|nr:hypothetical protein MACH16_21190 [Marinomonas pontica]